MTSMATCRVIFSWKSSSIGTNAYTLKVEMIHLDMYPGTIHNIFVWCVT